MEKKFRYKFIIGVIIFFIVWVLFSYIIGNLFNPYFILGGGFLFLLFLVWILLKKISVQTFALSIGMTPNQKDEISELFVGLDEFKIFESFYKDTLLGQFELYIFVGIINRLKTELIGKKEEVIDINPTIVFELPLKSNISSRLMLFAKNIWPKELLPHHSKKVKLESNDFNQKYDLYAGRPKDAYTFFNPIAIHALNQLTEPAGMTVTKNYVALYLFCVGIDRVNNKMLQNLYTTFKQIIAAHTNEKVEL